MVITRDISKVGDKSIVQNEFYALEKVLEKYEYGNYFRNLKHLAFNLICIWLDNLDVKQTYPFILLGSLWTVFVLMMIGWMQ